MNGTRSTTRHRYRVYGLTIETPFACADLAPARVDASVDVVVEEGAVATGLRAPLMSVPAFDLERGSFLCRGGAASGRFLARDGNHVVVERDRGAEDAMLAVRFSATVLPAILHQRGLLVLHANAAEREGRAVLVAGLPGAGKSTTLAALLDRGWRMLSDDVTVVQLGRGGRSEVAPGPARMHLTNDSASALRIDIAAAVVQPWRQGKAAVPTEPSMADAAARLEAVCMLSATRAQSVRCSELAGARKFDAMFGCLYPPMLAADHAAVFPLLSRVLAEVSVFELQRPEGQWSLGEVVDCVVGIGQESR